MPPSSLQPQSTSFRPEPIQWKSRRILPILGGIAAFFLVVVAALTLPIYVPRWQYAIFKPAGSATATPVPAPAANAAAAPVVSADPKIIIPKLQVTAPIVFEPSTNNDVILKALKNGVVHYAGTAVPGQIGNIAIFGHSSRDWWDRGDYNYIFVLLDKLVAGDRIQVNYQTRQYTYEVTGSKVVQPTDFSVLNPTAEPTLTLITCTPAGTSLRRLVVTARQIDPVPGSAVAVPVAAPVTANDPATQQTTDSKASLVGSDGVMTTIWNGWVSVTNGLF